jgi:hypothetical protein
MMASVLLAVTSAVLLPDRALAIPAFARKYETSCMTCHVAPPKLNAFGRAFKNRGYRMPKDDEDLIKQKQVALGAPAWKQVWPKGIWPASIPGGEFMSINFLAGYTINRNAPVTNEFDGLGQVSLLMGGTIGESLSFFGDFDLFENGEPGGIGRAYIQYNQPSHWFNVTLGQIQPRAQPFIGDLSLTGQTDYLANVFPTVTTGNFFSFSPHQRGIETWGGGEGPGGKGGFMWAAGVVNGEFGDAQDAVEGVPGVSDLRDRLKANIADTGGHFDVNSGKDFYFQGSYKIGGLGVFGSGASSTLQQTHNWRDDSLTLGGYFYRGTTVAFLDRPAGEVFDNSGNRFYKTGVTLDWWFKDMNIFGGYQLSHDRLKDGRIAKVGISTAEANYVLPWPWIQPAVREEIVKPDFGPSFNRTTLSATVLIRANMMLKFQGTVTRGSAPDWPLFDDQFRTTLRFVF